jgi:ATP phosphoribosyltransferase regulatory subunit
MMNGLLANCSLPDKAGELLGLLPSLTGGEEVLDKLQTFDSFASVQRAVESLRKIYGLLRDFGVQKHVLIDLGILRGFAYYTGTIFEGYIPEMGFPVLEGGRYDGLYADFGMNTQATGFAFNLEAMLALCDCLPKNEADVLVYGKSPGEVIKRCQELRTTGKSVEMALETISEEKARLRADAKGIPGIEEV